MKVAEAAEEDGVARATLTNPIQEIHELMWQPRYPKVKAVLRVSEPSARPTDGLTSEPNGDTPIEVFPAEESREVLATQEPHED